MSHADVYTALSPIVDIAHMVWDDGSAPSKLPWAVFYLDSTDGMFADGKCYTRRNNWIVELYQSTRDKELEEAIEEAIEGSFAPFEKSESYVESQRCLMTAYSFTEIERNQNG